MSTLTTYVFSKRKNSTLQPNPGTDVDIVLKNGANIISPVFTISSAGEPAFNYCKFGTRYYFVKSKTNIRNGLWEIECVEDFLATWKTNIGSTTALILYATGGRNDIIDERIPMESDIVINSRAVEPGFVLTPNSPKVFAGITGTGSNGLFLVTESSLKELMDGVDNWGQLWTDPLDALKQIAYGNSASSNLKSVHGIPIDITVTGTTERLYLGNYPCQYDNGTPISGIRVSTWLYRFSDSIEIPWEYSDWRRNNTYTTILLYIPCFGLMTIPASDVLNVNSLDIETQLNISNGDMATEVYAGGRLVCTATSNCKIDMVYGNTGIDSGKIIAGTVGGSAVAVGAIIGAVASGGLTLGTAGAIGGGLATIAGSIKSGLQGNPSGNAGMGGSAVTGADEYIHCWTINRILTDTPANLDSIQGKPVMQKATVSSYSGYIQTDGFQVAGSMLDEEREAINSALNGGIYYE